MKKYLLLFRTTFIKFFLLLGCLPVYGQLQEMNQIKKALPAVKDSIVYVDAMNRLAMLSHLRFRDSCLVYATRAKEAAVRLNYQKGIADAMNCQGIYYMSNNNYLSTKLFNDALKIYQALGDQQNQAQLLMNIAVLMFVTNNRTQALKYIYESDNKSKSLKNDSIRSIILTDILALNDKLSVRATDSIYREGLAIAKKYNDTRMIISFENNEGTILFNQGQKKKAIGILRESLRKADSVGCEYIKVAAYMTLGEMMLDLGRDGEGIDYYKKGLEISEKYGYPERYLMLADRLYQYYKTRKMPEKAYEYASLLLSKSASMSEDLKKSGYNYLSFVEKENELIQLKKDEKIQADWFLFMSCFSMLVLIILFFVYQSLLSKKKRIIIQQELYNTIQQSNTELEATAQFKKMIISVIAHDIRQPLATISVLSDVFNSDMFTESDRKDIMNELKYLSSKTMVFMDGVLSWIKARNEDVQISLERVNLESILTEANTFFEHDQKRNGLKMIFEAPLDITVIAHKEMALFVFRNLLNNATKVSPKGGVIRVSLTKTLEYVTVAVNDNGHGMTREQISGLFNPGHNTSHSGGAGLALSISKDMVSKMNGKIWAESEPLKGATFFVSLPT